MYKMKIEATSFSGILLLGVISAVIIYLIDLPYISAWYILAIYNGLGKLDKKRA